MTSETTKKSSAGSSSTTSQKMKVWSGIIPAVAFMVVTAWYAYNHAPIPMPKSFPDMSARFFFVFRCLLPELLCLMLGILMTGMTRFHTTAIDPLNPNSHQHVQVHKNYLQNTVEQLLVSIISKLVLASYLETDYGMRIIPILSAFFVIGRITFYIGYLQVDTLYRAFGFATNWFSNVACVGYCVYCAITRGLLT